MRKTIAIILACFVLIALLPSAALASKGHGTYKTYNSVKCKICSGTENVKVGCTNVESSVRGPYTCSKATGCAYSHQMCHSCYTGITCGCHSDRKLTNLHLTFHLFPGHNSGCTYK